MADEKIYVTEEGLKKLQDEYNNLVHVVREEVKQELKEENIERGRELVQAYCKSKGIYLPDLLKPEYIEGVLAKYGFRDWESILAAIGHGGLKEGQIVNKLLEGYLRDHKKEVTDEQIIEDTQKKTEKEQSRQVRTHSGIIVRGLDDVAVRFSKCCSPVPGDKIVGFVTRGRGVSIHRTDCVNIVNLQESERGRLIEAEWQEPDGSQKGQYVVEIRIFATNRTGLLVDISRIFTERKIDMSSVNSRTNKQGLATIVLEFQVSGKEELAYIVEKIRQVDSVIDIERRSG